MSNLRRDNLFAVVDRLTQIHNEWVDSDLRNPNDVYWDAVSLVVKSFDEGEIPNDCRKLFECASDLSRELEIFDARDYASTGYPQNGFWEARQRLEDARKQTSARGVKPMESIKELDAQGVSHEQIARMYKIVDPNTGEPQGWKIKQELAEPGSVIGKDWKDPAVAELERQQKESTRRSRGSLAEKSGRAEAASAPCPESPLELWQQGVSIEQSARMLKIPMAEVEAMFSEFDKKKSGDKPGAATGEPAADSSDPMSSLDPLDDEGDEDDDDPVLGSAGQSEQAAAPASETEIEEMVIEFAREGMAPADIAKEMKLDGRKVGTILRRRKADVEKKTEPALAEAATAGADTPL